MRRERALEIGRRAVGWLLAEPEQLHALMTATGVGADDLAALIEDEEFAGSALDFVLSSDSAVVAFAAAAGLRPDEPALAGAALAGPAAANWT